MIRNTRQPKIVTIIKNLFNLNKVINSLDVQMSLMYFFLCESSKDRRHLNEMYSAKLGKSLNSFLFQSILFHLFSRQTFLADRNSVFFPGSVQYLKMRLQQKSEQDGIGQGETGTTKNWSISVKTTWRSWSMLQHLLIRQKKGGGRGKSYFSTCFSLLFFPLLKSNTQQKNVTKICFVQ